MLLAIRSSLLTALLLSAIGCSWMPSLFEQDINQGNIFDQEALDRLEVGMTKSQVRFLLGNSAVDNGLNPQKWHYLYLFNPGKGKPLRRLVTLYFNGDNLSSMTGDVEAEEKEESKDAQTADQ